MSRLKLHATPVGQPSSPLDVQTPAEGRRASQTLSSGSLDRLGMWVSGACAVHCLITPLVASALPLFNLSLLNDPLVEWLTIIASLAIGLLSLAPGYVRRHRHAAPWSLFGIGAALLLAARLLFSQARAVEATIIVIGAGFVMSAHLTNLRLCRSCSNCGGHDLRGGSGRPDPSTLRQAQRRAEQDRETTGSGSP